MAQALLKHLLFLWEKQTRSVERHIRKMEFHISKVSLPPGGHGQWGGWGGAGLAGERLRRSRDCRGSAEVLDGKTSCFTLQGEKAESNSPTAEIGQ